VLDWAEEINFHPMVEVMDAKRDILMIGLTR
jgi:hypothetical protein